ncbi:ribonuclease H2, subunit B [Paramyrothecium foliicola]|nr:ribonuclease H2, subunit B [Paramyrothecium foliicola]
MPRTRSTKETPSEEVQASVSTSDSAITLAPQVENPPVVFILPRRATTEAQIVSLPHPRHSRPSRYLACPETGFYEFTRTCAPKTNPRSWLVEPAAAPNPPRETKAQVTAGGELYIATKIDPVFLLLPALADSQQTKHSETRKRLFLSSDDYFDKLPENSSHLRDILQNKKLRAVLESRMSAVCDVVEAGDENMFRLNEKKLATAVLEKAKKCSKDGLPSSMELKFVKKPLEAPIAIKQKAFVITESQVVDECVTGASTPQTEATDSQSSAATTESVATAATSVTEVSAEVETITRMIEPTAEIVELQRLRVSLDYICSLYISPALAMQVRGNITDQDSGLVDFSPLDDYLTKVATLRAEAFAERPVDFSQRKRGREEEDDEQLEKKRRLEEEKKTKAKESKSIKDLKKVDTSGMKKLSHFFKKK